MSYNEGKPFRSCEKDYKTEKAESDSLLFCHWATIRVTIRERERVNFRFFFSLPPNVLQNEKKQMHSNYNTLNYYISIITIIIIISLKSAMYLNLKFWFLNNQHFFKFHIFFFIYFFQLIKIYILKYAIQFYLHLSWITLIFI